MPHPQRKKPSSGGRKRRAGGSITLADVARMADVAMTTASRALNEPELVSPETLQRVRDVVTRTGYVPNLLAGGLASRRSRLIAAIVPTVTGPVFSGYIQAITDELAAANYQVMLGQSGYLEAQEERLLGALVSRRPDGLILTGIVHSPAGRRLLGAAGIPIVETWDLTPTPIDMLVGFSHEKTGAAVAEFFHARGVRRPGLVTANDPRAALRNKGFVETARKLGMPDVPISIWPAPSKLGDGRRGLADLLGKYPDLDAVACSSDFLALGVQMEAQTRGLKIPDQLAVMGWGDLNFAADVHPALSTVRIDSAAIGSQAARFIVDKIAGRPIPERVVDVGFSIVSRGSA